ncbi:MAG: SLC13 family permease [Thermodesulfobacteriota bacterium]|nr:SLC13 family permease [Thermodesulfobacteriota bacterium]
MIQRHKLSETASPKPSTILVVDDEDHFRTALRKQLSNRGYTILEAKTGRDAMARMREKLPEVVILDQEMPGLDGVETLRGIKQESPHSQVIMLTGHGTTSAAAEAYKYDLFRYMHKPCGIEDLMKSIDAAIREYNAGSTRQSDVRVSPRQNLLKRMAGVHNLRPGVLLLGLVVFGGALLLPASENVAFQAKAMTGTLICAALFWATGAIPIWITSLLIGGLMNIFGVLPPDEIARAYTGDAMLFITGVFVVLASVMRTGLDRRICSLLLGAITSPARLILFFGPILAMGAAFFPEHVLPAFLLAALIPAFGNLVSETGVEKNRQLAVMMVLLICFTANIGGMGAPTGGGKNAVMMALLADYNTPPSFGRWMGLGLPLVPVTALVVSGYLWLVFRKAITKKTFGDLREIREGLRPTGRMTPDEVKTIMVMTILFILWIICGNKYGLSGPVVLAVVTLALLKVVRWSDINTIHWDVIALYAGACVLGKGMAVSGAALWVADGVLALSPASLQTTNGLSLLAAFSSGILTNFMNDAAAVAVTGPVFLSMAGTDPWKIGMAAAFAASFSHMLIIATPTNAIAYRLARSPEIGTPLITIRDFFLHGIAVWLLSMLVLWGWLFLGSWQWAE